MRVMVLGAGGAAANGFINSLRAAGGYEIVGTNPDEYDLKMADLDDGRVLPPPDDPLYGVELQLAVNDWSPDFIHAQPDPEVPKLARFANRLNWPTFLPDPKTIRVCQDKWLLYENWRAAGLPVPETHRLVVPGDVGIAFKKLGRTWVRKRYGAGGNGAILTHDPDLAARWIADTGQWGEFTAAEYLPGKSITWQSVWQRGRVVLSQQRLRHGWAHGKIGLTRVAETVSDVAVETIAEMAVRAVDPLANGIFGVDMVYDKDLVPHLTEINVGRFFTTIEFFTRLGFNMPDLYVRMGTGGSVAEHLNPLPDGWLWIRGMDRAPLLTRSWTT